MRSIFLNNDNFSKLNNGGLTMLENLENRYILISSKKRIEEFIRENQDTLNIIRAMGPHIKSHFPYNDLSLEVCDNLGWTTETKLLLNVSVDENMFFNGMLDHFNDIYAEIESVIEDIENTVVLFPKIIGKDYDKMSNTSAINLIARTAYFNNYNDGIVQREMSFREIPKPQQVQEIIEYCKNHENPNISDIVYDLQLELFAVDNILDELNEKGIKLNVKY